MPGSPVCHYKPLPATGHWGQRDSACTPVTDLIYTHPPCSASNRKKPSIYKGQILHLKSLPSWSSFVELSVLGRAFHVCKTCCSLGGANNNIQKTATASFFFRISYQNPELGIVSWLVYFFTQREKSSSFFQKSVFHKESFTAAISVTKKWKLTARCGKMLFIVSPQLYRAGHLRHKQNERFCDFF